MKRKCLIIFIILILAFNLYPQTTSRNVSKTGTTAANFLEIPVGASATGMGAAFVSIANDATALYWNAAGISSLTQSEFKVVHTRWIAETNFDFASLVIPLGGIGTLGLSFTSLSMPDMKVSTVELPEGTGEYFSAGDIAVGLSYAKGITDRFSIGFNAKFIQQTIWHERATGFAIDAGTIFRTDLLNGLVIGASISNFGTKMQLSGRDTRTFNRVDPTKLGSNDEVPYNIGLDSWDLPLTFQIGISTNIVNSSDFKWTIAVDAVHPSDNYESMNTGTELSYRNTFFIRGGFQSLFLDQAEGGLSLGAGIYANNILGSTSVQFDYAYRDFGRLENIHVFGVGLRF
jgi:hypothetical protein